MIRFVFLKVNLVAKYLDLAEEVLQRALSKGASDAIVRIEETHYEVIVFDNGVLRSYTVTSSKGIGIRVVLGGVQGYSFTQDLSRESIDRAIERALAIARVKKHRKVYERALTKPAQGVFRYVAKEDLTNVDPEEKVKYVKEANEESLKLEGIVSSVTRMAFEKRVKAVASSYGARAECEVHLVGVSHFSVAKYGASSERVHDSKSWIGGYEHLKGFNFVEFAKDVSSLAIEAAKASMPSPGSYRAIIDNELVGLLIHEAFGHATEGDIVISGGSVLADRVGMKVASELITVVDQGVVEGGYPVPFDDEGNVKERTIVVERGILKGFLTSSFIAAELGMEVTGNARAESIGYDTLVRQTNYFIEPGDWSFEEMLEDMKNGLYLKGRGAIGGQVDTSNGTFTFSIGPSYVVERGEITKLVRGVSVSGSILETLANVDAVARDLSIRTSVFGGCGKGNQMVRVGDGGPHVRVKKIVVGGA